MFRLVLSGCSRLLKTYHARTDFIFSGSDPKGVSALFIASGDGNVKQISGPDNFSELDPAHTEQFFTPAQSNGNQLGHHVDLSDAGQNGITRKMAVEQG
jgi:hypothetical protein